MNLILFTEADQYDDNLYSIDDYRAEHIITILKSKVGDELRVGLINHGVGNGTIEEISDNKVVLKTDELAPIKKAVPTIDLICALPRPQTLKKILFICGMMGVERLFLIRANRVEKSFYHSPLLEEDNLRKHLLDGMMQGKNACFPKVEIFDRFKIFFEDRFKGEYGESWAKLLPDMDVNNKLKSVIKSGAGKIVIAIGPEGGWTEYETEFISELGFSKFSLGQWTLRVEHAALAALSQIEALKEI